MQSTREDWFKSGEFYLWLQFLANIDATKGDACYWRGCLDPSRTVLQQESPAFGNRELRFCWHHHNHVRDYAMEVSKTVEMNRFWQAPNEA